MRFGDVVVYVSNLQATIARSEKAFGIAPRLLTKAGGLKQAEFLDHGAELAGLFQCDCH